MVSASDVSLAVTDPFGLWHNHHGDRSLRDEVDEYGEFLREQGLIVEKKLLHERHKDFVSLEAVDHFSAYKLTSELLKKDGSVIYNGALESKTLGLRGRPDLLKIENRTCVLEEYKLAGKLKKAHKIQALVYAYLLKNEYQIENCAVVVTRKNEEFIIPYAEQEIADMIQMTREILSSEEPPYPVYNCQSAWGTLQNKRAKELQDVTLAWHVGAGHGGQFHQMNIHTLEALSALEPKAMNSIKGLGPKKVPQIVNSVKAQLSKTIIKVGSWIPVENTPGLEIFLDLEGTSELFQEDPEWNCIYLIGLIPRLEGKEQPYKPFMAGVPKDEEKILSEFIEYLKTREGPYRLYHWHHYEKTQLKKACERYGFEEACDTLILPFLEDLCTAAQTSYVLPIPGYSIKIVAPYFGFKWSQDSSEVDAMKSSMIWFRQAAGGGDGKDLEKVLLYNEDDCKAMIIVKDGFDKLEREGV